MVKKLSKKLKIQQTVVGGGVGRGGVGFGGEIVVPRPSASASLTGRRQKRAPFEAKTSKITFLQKKK
jgi:hypothetical protein